MRYMRFVHQARPAAIALALMVAVVVFISGSGQAAAYGPALQKPIWGNVTIKPDGEFGTDRTAFGEGLHTGIDIGASGLQGWQMYVHAPGWGTVEAVGYGVKEGNYIVLRHEGYCNQAQGRCPKTVFTKFYHLAWYVVRPGQTVYTGQTIGYVGVTGTAVIGAHLHFEIREDGRYGTAVNPREYVRFSDGKDVAWLS